MSIENKLIITQLLLIVLFIEEICLSNAIHKANEHLKLLEAVQDRLRGKVFHHNSVSEKDGE